MKKIISLLISLCLLLVGCSVDSKVASTKQQSNEITEIKFRDMMDIEELRKLDGQRVKITGFMAESSPLDGSMIYLMNMPYQNCVYCLPNTSYLINTMAVYPKDGKRFEFIELAIDIVGTLKFESITDEMSYSYDYRIVDAEVNYADIDDLNEEVKIYTALVDKGFINIINQVISEANKLLSYEEFELPEGEMQVISMKLIDELDSMFYDLDKDKYTDVLQIVSELRVLVEGINEAINLKEYNKLNEFKNGEMEIFYKIYEWLMKAEI